MMISRSSSEASISMVVTRSSAEKGVRALRQALVLQFLIHFRVVFPLQDSVNGIKVPSLVFFSARIGREIKRLISERQESVLDLT